MNTYKRALRHININDVKRKREEKIVEQKIKEGVLEKEIQETEIFKSIVEKYKSDWRKELSEGMTTKDFEYLYGISLSNIQINSVMGGMNVDGQFAQNLVQASSNTTDYQLAPQFPGSYINSIGDNQVTSQSSADIKAYFDTTFGNVNGGSTQYTLTTGPEGIPPGEENPPGSVVQKVNLETALGITLPSGFPNGELDGSPIEGSALKRVFSNAQPGKRINFNWSFSSSEDTLGPGSVDDYAFVAIKGQVTKLVSVLTKGLKYSGQFIYTVKPEDILPNGTVEIGIGVMDVYDPYVQSSFTISNFGTFWDAGSLGSTTDAADLGMSVAAATPTPEKKKKSELEPISKTTYFNPDQFGQANFTGKDLENWNAGKIYVNGINKFGQKQSIPTSKPYNPSTSQKSGIFSSKPSQSGSQKNNFTHTYDVVTDSGTRKVTDKISSDNYGRVISQYQTPPPKPPEPPKQQKLTPQQLRDIDNQIKQLQADNERIKANQTRRNWELAANLAMDVVTAAALLSPVPGDEAMVIGARTAAQTQRMAKQYTRANPGKYNPFMTDYQNKLARSQNLGSNAMPLRPLKNSHEPEGQLITEKKAKTFDQFKKELYPGQPSPNGFPDGNPPQPINGWHPEYGKRGRMYNTLDKISADSMPLTGDPETDKKVKLARKQPK